MMDASRRSVDAPGIAPRSGSYCHAVEVLLGARWFLTSSLSGKALNGTIPEGIVGQAEGAWQRLTLLLEAVTMECVDVVMTRVYLTRAPDIPAYDDIVSRYMNGTRPAASVVLLQSLANSVFVLEVELTAAKLD